MWTIYIYIYNLFNVSVVQWQDGCEGLNSIQQTTLALDRFYNYLINLVKTAAL